ncbi:MAG TPA: pitrilysin family protein [Saprospiraceae bacterium]|nr:pitrilysin family protein [Saprospiraceae bacterium]
MKKILISLIICLQVVISFAQADKYPTIDIPYKKFILDNGLTVIISEDHKIPMVAFNIWYHVGSKNEKTGKTGFAHLFEHIMFTGSEHYSNFDEIMQTVGGGSNNGTTNNDRTNFFENFTSTGLDRVLWVESDRMGYLLNGLDSAKVEVQRGVVQNEKRQGDNQPYAIAEELTIKSTYPAHHPYSWSVIGSMEDLSAASLEDVKEWFRTYYGPNNAIIAIVGDVNTEETLQKIKKYFDEIPASPPIAKHSEWIAKMSGLHVQTAQDRVPQARLQKTWNVPAWGTKDITYLELLSSILTNGVSSRLYKRLVYDGQLCTDIWSYNNGAEIGQQFFIGANAKPEVSLGRIDTIINEELNKIFTTGVTSAELELAKTTYFSSFIKGMERIGGFGGKSDILAESETYGGSPDYYKKIQSWIKAATPADLQKAAKDWLTDGQYVLNILPYGDFTSSESSLDRKEMPPVGNPPLPVFPAIRQFTLSNGLKVYLAERHDAPLVSMSVSFDAGYEADQFAQPGTVQLTSSMMKEGTAKRTAVQISDLTSSLGADLSVSSSITNTLVSLRSMKSNLDPSIELMSDVLLHPSFPQANFERVQKEQIIGIEQEKADPYSLIYRILPQLMYGKGHPDAFPSSGSGYENTVSKITRDDLVKFHDTWFGINNATMVIAGDVTEAEIKPMLEKYFTSWKSHDLPKKNITLVTATAKPTVYIIDMPDAEQTQINAALFSPAPNSEGYEALRLMNTMLGGSFLSRINSNLREDKHWSYGAFSFIQETKHQGLFITNAGVQTDKTKESIIELQKELTQVNGTKPITEEEFKKEQRATLLEIPGRWETNGNIRNYIDYALSYGKGLDFPSKYASIIQNLTLNEIRNAATSLVKPQQLTWLIIGDRKKIEAGVRELNLGTVKILDKDGNEIKKP